MSRAHSLVVLALVAGGCFMTRGNGEPAAEVREVDPFTALDVGGVFQLQAEQGSEQRVEVRGDANLLELVELEVHGAELRAKIRGNTIPDLPLQLIVRVPELREVELSGAARGELVGLEGPSLSLDVSGASDLRVSGRVKQLDAEVSGASELDASGLEADAVRIESSGASSAEVTANTALVAEASGASSIRWRGTATQVDRDASGASSIDHR